MAKQIARLLKTNIMADLDLPALAQLLSKKGRKGDTILAHINREEAQKLLEDGGSGTTNPDTGLPEFYEGEDYLGQVNPSDYPELYQGGELPPEGYSTEYTYPASEGIPIAMNSATGTAPLGGQIPTVTAGETPQEITAGASAFTGPPATMTPEDATALSQVSGPAGRSATPEEKGLLASLTPQQKLQFALSGGLTGLSAILGRRGIQQSKEAARQTRDIGTPYREQGQAMVSAAQRGELTPVGQQQLQAARAQLAQGAERRGGVGAQQTAVQLAQFKQNLLDTQYKYGLQIAQIGDQYAQRAITQGLTGDAEMARLMQGLAGSIGSIMGAQPTRTP